MRIILVRHAETEHNREDTITGQQDIPLSDEGLKQAEKLADRLGNSEFDGFYSSDLKRTFQTLKAVASRHDQEPEGSKLLRERSYGVYEGRHKDKWRDVISGYDGDDRFLAPENGESMEEAAERYLQKFNNILEKHAEDARVLVGVHGVATRALLLKLFDLNGRYYRNFEISNTGILELEYGRESWRLIRMNDTAHLE
jgi:broad specificity phosphatase PhoE